MIALAVVAFLFSLAAFALSLHAREIAFANRRACSALLDVDTTIAESIGALETRVDELTTKRRKNKSISDRSRPPVIPCDPAEIVES